MPQYLYIMDFNSGGIYEIADVPENIPNMNDFLNQYDFREDECSYMFSEKKLKIQTAKEL